MPLTSLVPLMPLVAVYAFMYSLLRVYSLRVLDRYSYRSFLLAVDVRFLALVHVLDEVGVHLLHDGPDREIK